MMRESVRRGAGGSPGEGSGRGPEAWELLPAQVDAEAVADAVSSRAFLYDDPGSFRAGVDAVLAALRIAASRPGSAGA
jgi:hypothetical protein